MKPILTNQPNIMNLFLYNSPEKDMQEQTINKMLPYDAVHDANEGSKFLHDAVHHAFRPIIYSEECIAAGCPEDLW